MLSSQKSGLITKVLGGFYYVYWEGQMIECRARGLFRKQKIKPLAGDYCEIRLTKEDPTKGYVEKILPRNNALVRPPVANVDQIMIVFACKDPIPNLRLLDKFLIQNEHHQIQSIIILNKVDLAPQKANQLANMYQKAGYRVIQTSALEPVFIDEIKQMLSDKVSAFAGPSGVGKSTLINLIEPGLNLEVGEISEKLSRGKHTTREVSLHGLSGGGWLIDTAGFSVLDLQGINQENLKNYYPEFDIDEYCRFTSCDHYREPDCAVKNLVAKGEICQERYDSYISLYELLLKGEPL